jgi:Anti-sigma factor NepR
MAGNERHPTEMQPTLEAPDDAGGDACRDVALPIELQGAIGQKLKMVYGQMLSEPLPDKFAQLLAELGKADKN